MSSCGDNSGGLAETATAIKPVAFSYGNVGVVFNGGALQSFDAGWFEANKTLAAPIEQAETAGRAPVFLVKAGERRGALKHYCRGGLLSRFVSDHYIYTKASRTRSFAEWHFLSFLRRSGLPAPMPLAARYVRFGPFYTADLITEYCQATRTLSSVLRHSQPPDSLWRGIGRIIRRYHDAGVCHADLNAHNILVDEEYSKVTLIDFDRAYRSRCPWRQRRNLRRLKRSLNKLVAQGLCPEWRPEHFRLLMRAYEKKPS